MCHTVYYILFQSTLLQEERPTVCINFSCSKSYFNPRSYKRSDEGSDKVNLLTQIFQSTLLQEERLNALNSGIYSNNFNPRSYKRSDAPIIYMLYSMYYFNPRSYKRSDNTVVGGSASTFDFNPRSYKRSDVYVVAVFDWWFLFQSTLLQEERQ